MCVNRELLMLLESAPRRTGVSPEPVRWRRLIERLLTAAADGDVAGLERLLTGDVVDGGDGGGSSPLVARKPVGGRFGVARLFSQMFPRYLAGPMDVVDADLPW